VRHIADTLEALHSFLQEWASQEKFAWCLVYSSTIAKPSGSDEKNKHAVRL
jgi:hypothetical protein